MISLLWLSALVLVHGSRSYVLLTANLDDVHAIAKQISESPVASQIHSILRRASALFNLQVRSKSDGNEARFPRSNPQDSDSSLEPIQDNRIERRTKAGAPQHFRHNHNQRSQDHHQSARRSETLPTVYHESTQVKNHEAENRTENTQYNKVRSSQTKDVSRQDIEEQAQREVDKDVKKRSHVDGVSSSERQDEVSRQSGEHSNQAPREVSDKRSHTDEVVALGKNASLYLSSIKKIIENV